MIQIFVQAQLDTLQIIARASDHDAPLRQSWVGLLECRFNLPRAQRQLAARARKLSWNPGRCKRFPDSAEVSVGIEPAAGAVRCPFVLNQMQARHDVEHRGRIGQAGLGPAILRAATASVFRP